MRRASLAAALSAAALVAAGAGPASAAPTPRCDPFDQAACLLPWPNDYFTRADRSSATGRRLALTADRCRATPRARRSTPCPTTPRRLLPRQPIVTKVPGLDNAARRSRPTPSSADRPGADLRPGPAGRRDRRRDPPAPAHLGRARQQRRHRRATARCSSTRPSTGARATATSSPCATCAEPTGGRCSRSPAFRRLPRPPAKPLEASASAAATWRTSSARCAGRASSATTSTWPGTSPSRRPERWPLARCSIRDRAFAELGDRDLADLRSRVRPRPSA